MIRYYISSALLSTKSLQKQHASIGMSRISSSGPWRWRFAKMPAKSTVVRPLKKFGKVRHIVLNYLKVETRFNGGIRRK
jgi:hypothetical protein